MAKAKRISDYEKFFVTAARELPDAEVDTLVGKARELIVGASRYVQLKRKEAEGHELDEKEDVRLAVLDKRLGKTLKDFNTTVQVDVAEATLDVTFPSGNTFAFKI